MVSSLATVICDKGKTKRDSFSAVLLHTTGSGIVEKAKSLGKDPTQYAAEFYRSSGTYAHYLIGHVGEIFSFCDELKWAAHAKWSSSEVDMYRSRKWLGYYEPGKVLRVGNNFYNEWIERWQGRGLYYESPRGLLQQVGGNTSPNAVTVGIEILDMKPEFSEFQHVSLAKLLLDIFDRNSLCDLRLVEEGGLPQAWLLTHSDIGPHRRYAKRKDGSGFGWDFKEGQLDWNKLIKEWKNV